MTVGTKHEGSIFHQISIRLDQVCLTSYESNVICSFKKHMSLVENKLDPRGGQDLIDQSVNTKYLLASFSGYLDEKGLLATYS